MNEEEILKRGKDVIEGNYGETLSRGNVREKGDQVKMTVSTPTLSVKKEGK